MRITLPMYEKGRIFVMAGGLVKAYEGHKFVYLHLLCQGFENIGKAMLLAKDYDKYGPKLKTIYHHHLDILLTELQAVYGPRLLSQEASIELIALSKFYERHELRYGNDNDFTVNVLELSAEHLHRELVELLGVLNERFAVGDQHA